MEFFTDSSPALISDKVAESFNKMIEDVKYKNAGFFVKLYDNVIYPNLGIFIVIAFIIIFLLYRYFTNKKKPINKKKSQPKETFNPESLQFVRGMNTFGGMDGPEEKMIRPFFNPSIPISKQESYVNYKPDEVMVNVNGTMKNNVKYFPFDTPTVTPKEIQYGGPYYRGTGPNNSDELVGDFIDLNEKNILDYNYMVENKQNIDPTVLQYP